MSMFGDIIRVSVNMTKGLRGLKVWHALGFCSSVGAQWACCEALGHCIGGCEWRI